MWITTTLFCEQLPMIGRTGPADRDCVGHHRARCCCRSLPQVGDFVLSFVVCIFCDKFVIFSFFLVFVRLPFFPFSLLCSCLYSILSIWFVCGKSGLAVSADQSCMFALNRPTTNWHNWPSNLRTSTNYNSLSSRRWFCPLKTMINYKEGRSCLCQGIKDWPHSWHCISPR